MAGLSRLKDGVASARLCPGHPRLPSLQHCKTWMPGTRLRQGFAEAVSALARRSFSEGGKAGHDELGAYRPHSGRLGATVNAALELTIDVQRTPVAERQDLHHDHTRDTRARIDPVIGI